MKAYSNSNNALFLHVGYFIVLFMLDDALYCKYGFCIIL